MREKKKIYTNRVKEKATMNFTVERKNILLKKYLLKKISEKKKKMIS